MDLPKILIALLLGSILIFRLSSASGIKPDAQDPGSGYRSYLSETIQKLLPEPQSALLSGILLGVKSNLPQDFRKALSNTSTTHIVVASGQNLTFVTGFVLALSPLIGKKKSITSSLIVIFIYSLLAGFQVPIVRAAIMLILISLAKLLNREADDWWIILLTVSVMLIYEPNWLSSISFQLSVLATVAVVILAPEVVKRIEFLPEIVKEGLAVSFCAQALTMPIIAANFYQISLSGVVVNSLVLWTIPYIMLTGASALALGLVNTFLGQLTALVPGILLTYFVYIINFFNSFGSLTIGTYSPLVWVGYYLIILGIYLYIKRLNEVDINP